MALEATHIRLALDLKTEYGVGDINKYISGTIYPDSRYITGIDRELTHNQDILLPAFAKDDFRKGWQVHQICDVIQGEMMIKSLPELSFSTDDKISEEEWTTKSAVKIIQDMNDLKCFDLQSYLKCLDYAYNPNGEDVDEIKRYNRIMIDLYKDKKETTVEDNYRMWLALGVSAEQGKEIRAKTYEFLRNERLVKRIQAVYKEMLAHYREALA